MISPDGDRKEMRVLEYIIALCSENSKFLMVLFYKNINFAVLPNLLQAGSVPG